MAFVAIQALGTLLGSLKGVYFSTPMTNGLRLIKWRSQNSHIKPGTPEYEERFAREVLAPNCQEGQRIAQQLRDATGDYVIDPSCFDVKGWSQEDYLSFWCCVIEKYAKEVRFNEGWEYSNGCTREFLAAQRAGIPTKDLAGKIISLSEALHAISNAIPALRKVSIPTNALEVNAKELSKFL
jgi:hypothetical protein